MREAPGATAPHRGAPAQAVWPPPTRASGAGFGRARERAALGAMAVALVATAILALQVGAVSLPAADVAKAVVSGLAGHPVAGPAAVVWALRVPRVMAAAVVGASLGAAGAAYQGLFRNPLADPYLMGVAAGAAFGATAALAAGGVLSPAFANTVVESFPAYTPAAAFSGALLAVGATLLLARAAGTSRVTDLILAGVAVGSVLTAATAYLMLRDADRVRSVFAWTLGNLAFAGWPQVKASLPYAAVGVGVLALLGRPLNALQLGEEVAVTLGLRMEALRLLVIGAASLATAAAVAQVGIVGFVGLMVPHMARRLLGGDYRTLVPASALGGAILVLVADLVARWAVRPAELPVGVVTALAGGPFFLYVLRRSRTGAL